MLLPAVSSYTRPKHGEAQVLQIELFKYTWCIKGIVHPNIHPWLRGEMLIATVLPKHREIHTAQALEIGSQTRCIKGKVHPKFRICAD